MDSVVDVLIGYLNALGETLQEVSAAYRHLLFAGGIEYVCDLHFGFFCGLFADEYFVFLGDVADYCLVELVSRHLDGAALDDTVE